MNHGVPQSIVYLASTALRIAATLLLAALLGLALVRLSPGYGVDERELDTRLSAESIAQLRAAKTESFPEMVRRYAARTANGDWGVSQSIGMPVRQLIEERWRLTLSSMAIGLLTAWALAVAWTAAGILYPWTRFTGQAFSFGLLAVPAGLVAFFCFLTGAPVSIAIAAMVFPQVFQYTRNLAYEESVKPHILAARARGEGRWTLLLRHIAPAVWTRWIAVLGVSAAGAAGAAIPAESICDSPGLGQLAWKAALGRDVDLLAPLILLIACCTVFANTAADLLRKTGEPA